MSKKILIVEDNAQDRLIIKRNLIKYGYDNLIFASTGEDGIEKARSQKPDLIILDINLPQMSGVELHLTLKNNVETRYIPILFNTNLLKTGEGGEGMEKFLAKSSNPEDMIKTITTLLASK